MFILLFSKNLFVTSYIFNIILLLFIISLSIYSLHNYIFSIYIYVSCFMYVCMSCIFLGIVLVRITDETYG